MSDPYIRFASNAGDLGAAAEGPGLMGATPGQSHLRGSLIDWGPLTDWLSRTGHSLAWYGVWLLLGVIGLLFLLSAAGSPSVRVGPARVSL